MTTTDDKHQRLVSNVEERRSSSNSLEDATALPSGLQRISLHIQSVSHKFWLFELGASLLSLLIFGTTLGVLKYFDNRWYADALKAPADGPDKRPTLFPVLAMMSAAMRAVMLLPVATAIGQLKWGWFRSERRLVDIEKFDEASRGILGSLKLIWILRFRNIAVIGAALMILALPLYAIIQISVRLELIRRLNTESFPVRTFGNITDITMWPRTTSFDSFWLMGFDRIPWPTIEMINRIKFGMDYASGLDFMKAEINVACPAGYCHWNKFQSLGIYYTCVDRTKEIETFVSKDGSAPFQTFDSSDMKFYHSGIKNRNTTFERQILSAMTYDDWPKDTYGDNRHGLWHIDTLEPSMDNSLPIPMNYGTTIDTPSTTIDRPEPGIALRFHPDQCFVEGNEVRQDHNSTFYEDNCGRDVYENSVTALQNMLTDFSTETGMGSGLAGRQWLIESTSDGPIWQRSNDFAMNFMKLIKSTPEDRLLDASKAATLKNIELMWRWISKYMVMVIRNDESKISDGSKQKLYKTGKVERPEFFYVIDWPRLGGPAFIVVFSVFFVLLTAITTRKEHQWKRSMLPLLFHGLGDRERAAVGDVGSFINMEHVAQKLYVELEEHADSKAARFTTRHE